jgi:hypothetical protein
MIISHNPVKAASKETQAFVQKMKANLVPKNITKEQEQLVNMLLENTEGNISFDKSWQVFNRFLGILRKMPANAAQLDKLA